MHPDDADTLLELVRDVELLCLDAGNTVIFLDHDAVAEEATAAGFPLSGAALRLAEGETKRRLGEGPGRMADPLPDADIPAGWSQFMRTMVEIAGLSPEEGTACVRALWPVHAAFNFWRRVPEGLRPALTALRQSGVPVCIVSNSEGMLDALFTRLGIRDLFDRVIDSHLVGFEKPDPRIFHAALESFGTPPARALHLGDTIATDVDGAVAAGVRAGLIDPFGHYDGAFEHVVRVRDVATVARTIVHSRR